MKKLMTKLVTLTLVFALVCCCTAGASAADWKSVGKSWESWGESIGDFWEDWGENVGDKAEAGSEDLEADIEAAVDEAGAAKENADVGGFVKSISTAVSKFTKNLGSWFKF